MGEDITPASAPAPELYPGHAEELRRHQQRLASIEAAAREPLPGPLLEAYAHVPFEIAGFTIRPLVHYDFVLLTRLNSPLIEQMRGKKETAFSDEQAYEMIWQFSRPCRVVAAELAAYEREERAGDPQLAGEPLLQKVRERFRARAIEEIGCSVQIGEAALLVKAIEREITRAFSTAVKYVARVPDGTNFTPPLTQPTTGSVGGSTTSRV